MFRFFPEDFGDDVVRIEVGENASLTDYRATFYASLSHDGRRVLVVSSEHVASVWDSATGRMRFRLPVPDVRLARFSPDDDLIVTVSGDHTTGCWRASSGKLVSECSGHQGVITDMAFIRDGARLVTVSGRGEAIVWRTQSGKKEFTLSGHETFAIDSVDVSQDGKMIVTAAGRQRAVVVWNSANGDPIAYRAWLGESQPLQAVFDPAGKRIALMTKVGATEILKIGVWPHHARPRGILMPEQLRGLAEQQPLPYLVTEAEFDDNWGRRGAFSPDGQQLIVIYQATGDPTVWSIERAEPLSKLEYDDQITSIATYSPDGNFVLTATGVHPNLIADSNKMDSQVAGLWDPISGKDLFLLHGHTGTITCAEFDAAGRRILTASLDGTVLVWTVATAEAALFAAALQGDTEAVRTWLSKGVSQDFEIAKLMPAHAAAMNGFVETLDVLLQSAGTVQATTRGGATPLYVAARHGQHAVVRHLLANGADPEIQLESGLSAMHIAACEGHLAVVEALVENGAIIDVMTPERQTPLFLAARYNQPHVAEWLIDRGASVHLETQENEMVLYCAAFLGMAGLVEKLLAKGAATDVQCAGGYSALPVAAEHGHTDIVRCLLAGGAAVDIHSDKGFTALHMAAMNGHDDIVESLIEHGSDVQRQTVYKQTPLYWAAESGHTNIIVRLLDAGAPPDTADEGGTTPLHAAAQNGHVDALRALLEFGATTEHRRDDSATPLLMAICNEHVEAVKTLLDFGADSTAPDANGVLPIDHAKNSEIAAMLR